MGSPEYMDYDCIIIGGGAAGLMLAARLDLRSAGARGIILEKTGKPGSKLLMSGGGHCNITHGGSIKNFVGCYGDAGKRLRKALYRYSNTDLASWLESSGIALADESGEAVYSRDLGKAERIFPASMKASDVLDTLVCTAKANGWDIRTGTAAEELEPVGEGWQVMTSSGDICSARSVVIATGGITYPETGSDGSMFEAVRDLGIEVTPLRPALAPVYVDGYPYKELSGVTLPDVTVSISSSDSSGREKKQAARMTGSLLFTHIGFSGPVILNISRYAYPGSALRISYGKELSELPRRMRSILEDRSRGPSGDVRTSVLSDLLESDDFVISLIGSNGMVTAGGISLGEISTGTMELKRFPGLYAIGEALDVDGITGGYNLQMCWSTASAAAASILLQLPQDRP